MDGEGIEQDYVEAYKWMTLGISGYNYDGKPAPKLDLDVLIEIMTPEQIETGQKMVDEWNENQILRN